ncbi:MAG: carboxylesterase family protein [Syntrophales bacterium]|nr:carboxylesterase family protein [Syntrophales bacterium]
MKEVKRRRLFFIVVLLFFIWSCGGGTSGTGPLRGVFVDAPVAGLDYVTSSGISGKTDANGMFYYDPGDMVTFKIGNLNLGTARGSSRLTPVDIVAGGTINDRRVQNMMVLLQTLDEDGDLNNGIKISTAAAAVISSNASKINFDQATSAFAADTNITALLTALNSTSGAFTDRSVKGDRTLRSASAAVAHFNNSTAERIVVDTQFGKVSGFAVNETTWQWLGIPYAKPPIGSLRWKPPEDPAPWTGVREATNWGDQAAQNPYYKAFGEGGMSEDCLYLNITAPKNAKNLPVMVWFHGGGFYILTGNTVAFNNPNSLPKKNVVLVTVNHRLGAFGYLAHPWLTQEASYKGSGNYGQMDLVKALQWIKNNIANFGGDPNNVTIFGESGGGGKVISLTCSPLAKGLFHKAIAQSGGIGSPDSRTLSTAENIGVQLTNALGVTDLTQLRSKTWQEIEQAARNLSWQPNVDNYYMPNTMRYIYDNNQHNDVPLMGGYNNQDLTGWQTALRTYFPWIAARKTTPSYPYVFTKVPEGWASKIGAYHGCELLYVFNYPRSLIVHYLFNLVTDPATGQPLAIGDLNGDGKTGSQGDTADIFASAGWGVSDDAMAETMMTIWTNFARTGNPSTSTFTWPAYTSSNDSYAELGKTLSVKTGLSTLK